MSEVVIEIVTACTAVLLISLIVRFNGAIDPFDKPARSRSALVKERLSYALVAVPYVAMAFFPLPFIAFVGGVWAMAALSRRIVVRNESWLWVRSNLLAVYLILPHAIATALAALLVDKPLSATALDPTLRCIVLLGSLVLAIAIGSVVGKNFDLEENTDDAFGKSLRPLSWFAWFALVYIAFDALANDVEMSLESLNLFVLASQVLLGIGLAAFTASSGKLGREAFREEQYLRLTEEAHAEEARMEDLHRKAYTDALTGLASRRYAVETVQSLLDEGRRFCLVFIDMNDFKLINDTYGHARGDASLVRMAEALRAAFGADATICRMGGDEFLAVLEGSDADAAQACAQAALAEVSRSDGDALALSFCYGVLEGPLDDMDPAELIHRADVAMYERKNAYHRKHDIARSAPKNSLDGVAPVVGREV